jgi:hypothetical protein
MGPLDDRGRDESIPGAGTVSMYRGSCQSSCSFAERTHMPVDDLVLIDEVGARERIQDPIAPDFTATPLHDTWVWRP